MAEAEADIDVEPELMARVPVARGASCRLRNVPEQQFAVRECEEAELFEKGGRVWMRIVAVAARVHEFPESSGNRQFLPSAQAASGVSSDRLGLSGLEKQGLLHNGPGIALLNRHRRAGG